MTLEKAILTVLLGTAASGAIGAAIGAALGMIAPTFFLRRDISELWSVPADPVETGLALGAISGLMLGAIGCVLLAVARMLADARIEAAKSRDAEEGA